uniref:Nuclear transcription factor Y subunit gamma n=1 Tax=Suricata suricatta TaxID=37032 RepID=A0A673TW16_SURSU
MTEEDMLKMQVPKGNEEVVRMSTEGGFGGTSSSDAQQSLQSFWPRVMEEIRNLTVKDFRVQELPLARIKKIMKLDEDVKMISAEAPVLFAKAAQIFITELTLRAWIHTEDNKRRTLQRNDIAMAITKFDQFDFLIDIVPRDELKPPKRQEEVRQSVTPAEPVQYYFTLAQQPTAVQVQGQQQGQQTTSSTTTIQPGQIIIAQPQQGQTTPVTMQVGEGQQVQIVQAQPQGQAQQAQSSTGQTMQVMQQIITNTGEIQQIPVQLNAGQLQYIRLAQPVSGTQVVQGQIQTLATSAPQITQTEVQQGQQQFSQFTDGQVGRPARAGVAGSGRGGGAGEINGSGWLGQLSYFLLTSRQIVKVSSVWNLECKSFRFRFVGAENNLRHYIVLIPILQMSQLSPRDEQCLLCADSALHSEPELECGPPVSLFRTSLFLSYAAF